MVGSGSLRYLIFILELFTLRLRTGAVFPYIVVLWFRFVRTGSRYSIILLWSRENEVIFI